ncbi:hypothetical protein [Streptomyces sp. NPDC006997]|uniref:hypothetical protein n=1 Tax=Streptomyces sp. NPDC006997 TaxID=3155356 RepID=UPI0034107C1A
MDHRRWWGPTGARRPAPGRPAAERAAPSAGIEDLVRAYARGPVVIVLDERVPHEAAVCAVLRAHRTCDRLGALLSVATHSAPVRRLLEAHPDTGGHRLVVHARVDTAIEAAYATTV